MITWVVKNGEKGYLFIGKCGVMFRYYVEDICSKILSWLKPSGWFEHFLVDRGFMYLAATQEGLIA